MMTRSGRLAWMTASLDARVVGGRRADLHVARPQHQAPAARHRVAGVHHEVDDDLLELHRIGGDPAHVRIRLEHQVDVLADHPPQQRRQDAPGADLDERSRDILDKETSKLFKDQEEEIKIVKASFAKKIKTLLSGHVSSSKVVDEDEEKVLLEKKGVALVAQIEFLQKEVEKIMAPKKAPPKK